MTRRFLVLVVFSLFAISAMALWCTPNYQPPRACDKMRRVGCVCTWNGECKMRDWHPCSICKDSSIRSAGEENERCPRKPSRSIKIQDNQKDVQELFEYLFA